MFRPLVHWVAGRGQTQRLSIFIYHRVLAAPDPLFPGEVDAPGFDAQVSWITNWFSVLPLQEAVQRLRDGSLPPGAAAITFDDGYADNLHYAQPVLQRYNTCATLFVATGFVDGGCMWNDRVIEAVRRTSLDKLMLPQLLPGPIPLASLPQRQAAIGTLIARLKYLPMGERDQAVEDLVHETGVNSPTDLMLSRPELQRWYASGQQVGAHTVNHPILARLDDATAFDEITRGRHQLQTWLDDPVSLFAYPNGKPGEDYLPIHVDMVQRTGFSAAVSTRWGAASVRSPIFELPRFTPWDRSRLRFAARAVRNLLDS